jgi:anti-sigma B factor antagonist
MPNNDIVAGFDDQQNDCIRMQLQTTSDLEGCLVVYLTGYIDIYNWEWFVQRIKMAIDHGYFRLIFHCSGMNMVSSCLIGALVTILKIIKNRGGDLILLEIQPKVYECFEMLGFGNFFNIKERLSEAVSYFNE